ncbi:MAG TPA: hypothetical protein VFC78_22320, partial [Tepidisphaeraceae bacterium]|nr:hypothetical protein [Tepidisphaeraceae bacterium]
MEFMPDGNTETVFTNYNGEPMLVDQSNGSQHSDTYYRYDGQGHAILEALPSAVTGYDATNYLDLVNYVSGAATYLSATSGLIATNDYYNVGWQFAGLAGVSSNGSGISGTLAAPEGTQAAFLTGGGTMTQAVAGWAAGSYTLSFKAAQSAGSGQTFEILLDGTPLTVAGSSVITPGAAYGIAKTTDSFTVSAGTHTIEFEGLGSGSDTALIDQTAISGTSAQVADAGFESPSLESATVSYDPLGSTGTGGVTGYYEDSAIQNGTSGTPVPQEAVGYLSHGDSSGAAVYPQGTDTVYRNSDGTGAEVTSAAYTWATGSNQVQSATTTLPVISSLQNGSGTANSQSVFLDAYGNPIWTKDAAGHVNYAAYDPATGAVIETITDVDATLLTAPQEASFDATGWADPTGGLNLATSMQVDPRGRDTEVTDANGNKAYTIYDDVNHQTITFPGWNATTHTTTGPVVVSGEYWPASGAGAGQQTVYDQA